jgi:CheY-like chemotaxis protein
MVIGLVSDLFFSARVRETAKQLGLPCEILKDPAGLVDRVRQAGAGAVVIADMNLKTGDAVAAVRALRADPATQKVPVIGFLHDVQEELMLAAEQAGCDQVLSKGQLTRRLPDLLGAKAPR